MFAPSISRTLVLLTAALIYPWQSVPAQSPPARSVTATVGAIQALQVPGTREVRITYDLQVSDSGAVPITLEISSDGGKSFNVPARTVRGDLGAAVFSGRNKTVFWNAGADWDQRETPRMRFRIQANPASASASMSWMDQYSGTIPGSVYQRPGITPPTAEDGSVVGDDDGDGYPDAWSTSDSDQDGLSDLQEVLAWTNLNQGDSDGDGLSDLREVVSSYPLNQSTTTNFGYVPGNYDQWPIPPAGTIQLLFFQTYSYATDFETGNSTYSYSLDRVIAYVVAGSANSPVFREFPASCLAPSFSIGDTSTGAVMFARYRKSSPLRPDTDGDRMADKWEVEKGLDPSSAADRFLDLDRDSVPNYLEFVYNTNPNVWDRPGGTSFQEILDAAGVQNTTFLGNKVGVNLDGIVTGTSPSSSVYVDPHRQGLNLPDLAGTQLPADWVAGHGLSGGLQADTDQDGLTDAQESDHKTDPTSKDSDGDDLTDKEEVVGTLRIANHLDAAGQIIQETLQSDPTRSDTDNDQISDGAEILLGMNPSDGEDSTKDPDED
ncbi:MAG: hypothetical protein ABL994_15490, partial [Verrucomicrobiales bacterium]